MPLLGSDSLTQKGGVTNTDEGREICLQLQFMVGKHSGKLQTTKNIYDSKELNKIN
jgi:hypothetical protein